VSNLINRKFHRFSFCIITKQSVELLPLDDGLRVQEAAEACLVKVIKFTKAG